MKNLARVTLVVCIVGFLASFFFGISFYYRDFPGTPRPELGRTHPINNHGFPLYLTKREELEQTWSFVLAVALFVSASILDQCVDPFDKRKRQMMPKSAAPWNHRWGP
jgi:hypothetical protein